MRPPTRLHLLILLVTNMQVVSILDKQTFFLFLFFFKYSIKINIIVTLPIIPRIRFFPLQGHQRNVHKEFIRIKLNDRKRYLTFFLHYSTGYYMCHRVHREKRKRKKVCLSRIDTTCIFVTNRINR
jgi:hypothetical protein